MITSDELVDSLLVGEIDAKYPDLKLLSAIARPGLASFINSLVSELMENLTIYSVFNRAIHKPVYRFDYRAEQI